MQLSEVQRRSDDLHCQIQLSIHIMLCEADTAMASIGNKRDWEISEIEEGKGVCIHGIPVNVSPVKESRSSKEVFYFEAKLSDGKRSARVVSFDTSHLDNMKKAEVEQSMVALNNSTVKKSSFSSELEVHLNKRSKVAASPRKLSLDLGGTVLPSTSRATKIAEIVDLTVNQGVGVVCNIVKVNDVAVVRKSDAKELQKQDIVIGDETGSCRLVLWEDDVGSLEEGKSHHLLDVVVRRYGTAKYLSYSSQSSQTLAEDMKDVNDEDI